MQDEKQFIPFVLPAVGDQTRLSRKQSISSQMQGDSHTESSCTPPPNSLHKRTSLGSDHDEDAAQFVNNRQESFKDVVLAARAAAEAAERAAAAARAAASLASKKFDTNAAESSSDSDDDDDNDGDITSQLEAGLSEKHVKSQFDSFNNYTATGKPLFDEPEEGEGSQSASTFPSRTTLEEAGQSVWPPSARVRKFDDDDDDLNSWNLNNTETFRSTSFESTGAGPHFDTDQADTESIDLKPKFETPHVHPKLPDLDDLSARFEALRSKR